MIHQETPMLPPPRNVVFTDPDFGSSMVRATDATTNFKLPGTFLGTEGSGKANEWSADTSKFYVLGKGGQTLVFAFDPAAMAISSLPNATPGQGFLLHLRPGASFGFVDPDLIYGTSDPDTLTIKNYRFSTGTYTPVIDTRACGVQPPLGSGPSVVSDDDVTLSLDDSRVSMSEGGSQFGKHMFVVVYDKNLGCRWYNTQTGQIGGQWGATGVATVTTPYLIRHAYLSRSGNYVLILVNWFGWYIWDLSTLNVSPCPVHSNVDECAGYNAIGYNSIVNGPAIEGDMQAAGRPLNNISQISQLVSPVSFDWGQAQQFTWSNVDKNDSTPVCGSTHNYEGDTSIDRPFAGEIFCIETDGLASTVWRFAHNRATYVPPFFHTQPHGSVSMDGRFFLFTSDWDRQLGMEADGRTPLSDVFIIRLD
ncbi:MAG TPA: hypothetical protein VN310_15165 [Candidatus Dormibacteraeota bacterium]|nr:hypothetical protein [Candidatus Dormibacteraeota bacterium]